MWALHYHIFTFNIFILGREFHYPDETRRRPPVPTTKDQPLMGLKTSKNFITNNAVQNITSVPKVPAKIYVDTRKGDKNLLEPSGLEPVYVHRKVNLSFSDIRTELVLEWRD